MLTSSKQLELKRYQSKPKPTTKQIYSRFVAESKRPLEESKYAKERGSKIPRELKVESRTSLSSYSF